MIFATIGTQVPFDRFVQMLDNVCADLDEEVIVQSIGGEYEPQHLRKVDFLPPDEFNELFSRARMVVAHAGMGTILSALTQNKPLVVVPRLASLHEHRNDHQGYFEDPGYSINEYQQDGGIVTTSLINDAFPLIRYRVDDIIDTTTDKEGSTLIKGIEGRRSTCLIGKDGTIYSSALLTRIFKSITTIDYSQFIQENKGVVSLNIVVSKDFTDADMTALELAVREHLGKDNFEIVINKIEITDLTYTARGKFSYIINAIDRV